MGLSSPCFNGAQRPGMYAQNRALNLHCKFTLSAATRPSTIWWCVIEWPQRIGGSWHGVGLEVTVDAALSNTKVLEKLINTHESHIRRFLQRRSGPRVLKRATLDDLYQETVAAALASARSFVFRDDRSFLAWISTIARRVIARSVGDPAREARTVRIRRAESSGVGTPEAELLFRGRTPSSLAAAHERHDDLGEAIGKLPEHYRRVLTLYKLEERALAEVAQDMGRTKGATCRLIARAINELREILVDQ